MSKIAPMKVMITGMALLCLIENAAACANVKSTKYDGTPTSSSSGLYDERALRWAMKQDVRSKGLKMEQELRGSTNFNDRSDYAVALMYLGESQRAVEILRALEKEKPGEYFVAANLGTALELSGNDEEALHWINEGIRRDPKSHQGTEWLHVKILEAKLTQKTDAGYLKTHTVLDLNPNQPDRKVMFSSHEIAPEDVATALRYQLKERLQFVKPPDEVVAGLLFDFAAVAARTRTLESAVKVLQMAAEYGYPTEKLQPLLRLYNSRIAARHTGEAVIAISMGIGAIVVLLFLYKKGIFVLTSRDLKPSR